MKTLTEYINESRYFKLTEYERQCVAQLIDELVYSEDKTSDHKMLKYWEVLSDNEKEQFRQVLDVFNDDNTWPYVNRNMIKDDIEAIVNFLNWVDENDLWGDAEYDGPSALEKLES